MIDLHIHTKRSDGTDNYISILEKAEEKKLSYISITDHDNCYIYEDFNKINISDYYTGKIITGVELKTIVNGIPIELLGYGVDPVIINEEVKKIYTNKKQKDLIKMERLYKNCKKVGVKLEKNILEKYENNYTYSTTFLHENITKNEENKKYILDEASWKDDTIFFRKHMSNPDSLFYVHLVDLMPSCDKIIELIKKAGGLVFIPHIYIYRDHAKNIFNTIVNEYKIDGVECYYSLFKDEQTNYLLEYCNKHNIYISGGTDYHGANKKSISLGIGKGNMDIPEDITYEWIDKINNKFILNSEGTTGKKEELEVKTNSTEDIKYG